MDRPITQSEKRRARLRKLLRAGAVLLTVAAAAWGVASFMMRSVSSAGMKFATVEQGTFENSVNALGKVVPSYEEVITSPVSSRILEVYCRPGDSLREGTPLLRLDLQATEAEVSRLRDSRLKQQAVVEQTRVNNESAIQELEMQIRVKQLSVSQLRAEADNERRLDSIGSGTGQRVQQAELSWRTASMELDQLRRRLDSQRRVLASTLGNQQLDLNMAERDLAQHERILADARICSPRAAVLTYIYTDIGSPVSQGQKLAVIADLSSFRIDAETSEEMSKYLTAGGEARIRVGGKKYNGVIMNVSPTSLGSSAAFSVIPDSLAAGELRPGMTVNVYAVWQQRSDVLYLPLGAFYSNGAGDYDLYVETSDGIIERRNVALGEANSDRVEVVSGLMPGEKVMIQGPELTAAKYKIKDTRK